MSLDSTNRLAVIIHSSIYHGTPKRGLSGEKLTPEEAETEAKNERKRKEHDKELEKRYPKVISATVSADDKSAEGKKKQSNVSTTPRRQLKQISCEEMGRVNRPIEDEPYYHGFMTRAEADKLLKRDGEFLVRKTDVGGQMQYILSVVHCGQMHNFLIKRTNKKRLYWVYNFAFKTVGDLVQHHYRNREPISSDGYLLVKPCLKKDWQLNNEQVVKGQKLGEGAFGDVWKGTLQVSPFLPKIPVAIKTLQEGCLSGDERIKFLKEANLMLELNHPNVIKIYGVCTAKEPIMIVMELAPGDSLIKRVEATDNPLTLEQKLNYVYGGAKGMAYLEGKKIIHRDIAARNCLLGKNDEVKISDFGLSQFGAEFREKSRGRRPVRWMAPETLRKGVYTSKSDVYGFGVLIYEIYSSGREPFEDVPDNQIMELVKMKKENRATLDVQGEIQTDMNEIFKKCLLFDPDERPSFEELEAMVKELPGIVHPPPPSIFSRIASQCRKLFGRS